MSKYISNVVNFQEYKDKKNKQLESDREELFPFNHHFLR